VTLGESLALISRKRDDLPELEREAWMEREA